MVTTITSRDFNRDVSGAKRAARQGPVVITDHGRRSHVLLTAEDYDRISGADQVVGDRLRMLDGEDIDLPLADRSDDLLRVPDL